MTPILTTLGTRGSSYLSLRSVVKNLALLSLSLCVVFAVVETGTWIWLRYFTTDAQLLVYGTLNQNSQRFSKDNRVETFDKAHLAYTPHRYIGYIPTPNFKRGKNYHNARGYRGEEFSAKKPQGEFRIACLGSSTTYGPDVEDPLQTYPAQLERILKERGFPNVRVINGGAAGWTSFETLSNFIYRVRYLDPDLVVIYEGINDVGARMIYPFRYFQSDNSGFMLPPHGLPPQSLYMQSNAIRCLLIRLGRAQSPMSLNRTMGVFTENALYYQFLDQYIHGRFPSGVFNKVSITELFAHNSPVYYVQNLRTLVTLAKAAGIQPVLLTFHVNTGVPGHYSYREFVAGVAEQNEQVVKLSAETGVPLLDFASIFPNRPEDYVDPIHLNEAGCRHQAEVIADFLIKEKLAR